MEESFYENCGYIATFLGTLFEGELSLITSTLGAKMGYYSFVIAMIFAFAGAAIADWFKFIIGKTKGNALLERKDGLKSKFEKVSGWFDKYPFLILSFYKFFFGFTTIILLTAGLKNVSYFRFAIHTSIAIFLWVIVLSGLAYHCSEFLLNQVEYISNHKFEILIGLFSLAFVYWLFVKRPFYKKCIDCD